LGSTVYDGKNSGPLSREKWENNNLQRKASWIMDLSANKKNRIWHQPDNHGAYARIVTATTSPSRVEEAVELWQEVVLPSVQQQRGFKGVRLLVDRTNGKIVSIGLWESEADFLATVAWNEDQIARFTSFLETPPVVEGYEVVVDI